MSNKKISQFQVVTTLNGTTYVPVIQGSPLFDAIISASNFATSLQDYNDNFYIKLDGTNSDIDVLNFNQNPQAVNLTTAQFAWAAADGTFAYGVEDGGLIQLSKELFDYYVNVDTVPLVNGDVVSIVPIAGNRKAVARTDVTNATSAKNCIGMVTVPSVSVGATGRVTKFGEVHDLLTSLYPDGTELFVSESNPGKWATVGATPPNYTVKIGTVIVSQNGNGIVELGIQCFPKLGDLSDVNGVSSSVNKPIVRKADGVIDAINTGLDINGITPSSGTLTVTGDLSVDDITSDVVGANTVNVTDLNATDVESTNGFVKTGSSDNQVLLGAGGAKNVADFQLKSEKGQANGYASLGSDGLLTITQLPIEQVRSQSTSKVPSSKLVDDELNITVAGRNSFNYGEINTYNQTTAGANFFLLANYTQTKGWLAKLSVNVSVGGNINLVIVKKTDSNYFKISSIQLSTIAGINNFFAGVHFADTYISDDMYVGIESLMAGLRYSDASGDGYLYKGGGIGDAVTTLSLTASQNIKYSFCILKDSAKQVSEENKLKINTLNYISKFNSLDSKGDSSVSSQTTGVGIFVANTDIIKRGYVTQIKVNSSGCTGINNANLVHYKLNTDSSISVISSQQITLRNGINTLVAGIDFTEIKLSNFENIGIYVNNTASKIKYAASGGNGYYYYLGLPTNGTSLSFTANGKAAIEVTVAESEKVNENFISLEEFNLTALPSGWTAGGGQTSDGTKITATSNVAPFYSGKTFGSDDRQLIWRFKFIDANAIVYFITKPIESGITSGSCIAISQSAISINGITTNGNYNSSVKLSQNHNYNLTVGRFYDVIITKVGRKIIAEIVGVDDNVYAKVERMTSKLTYTEYPTYANYDQGTMQGAIGAGSYNGSSEFYKVSHRLLLNSNIEIAAFGDSITEGFTVLSDANRYGELLKTYFGSKNVLISGIGGAVTDGVLKRFVTELQIIKAKKVFVFIGSNADASLATNIIIIVNLIKSCGAIPFIATVPTSSSYTTTINGLAPDVVKVKLDLALTQTGAGSTRLVELYQNTDESSATFNDTLHPNDAGQNIIFKKIMQLI